MEEGAQSLEALANEYWEERLHDDPVFATVMGDRHFDDQLPAITQSALARKQEKYESMVRRCEGIEESSLTSADRLTRSVLLVELSSIIDRSKCHLEEWTVDPLEGPQVDLQNIESFQPVRIPLEGRAMARRWWAVGKYLDDHVANLRRGASQGKFAVRACVEKVVDELQDLSARDESGWAFVRPLQVPHPDWTESERKEFDDEIWKGIRQSIRPAFDGYLVFLRTEILPQARPEEKPGISNVPEGKAAYERLIKVHTSLDLAPHEIHQTGLNEVAKINIEMENLGEKVFGIGNRKQIIQRLRTDPSLYFASRDEVAEKAEAALSKGKDVIAKWFGRLPEADCEVVRMEEHEEKHSTIAYYRQPATDGSRPGRYYINTSSPETRPRYEAEVLAYHEAIPGHHLQIAIAQELQGIPEFRKNSGVTAFIEGWGLYSERLADEMRLYSSDLDRIGVLSYDAWRACRLVVDTGMHYMGWTREQAIDFMVDNTALARNNIINEVDRYITWPGQALAYKTGQLEIVKLRHEAMEKLGAQFDLRRFHDELLGSGALPIMALREIIADYIAKQSERESA